MDPCFFEKTFNAKIDKDDNLKLTSEEKEKFLNAMKEKKFQTLFYDYLEEISDPKNRQANEEYIMQLEKENKIPTNKQIIHPTEVCVLKMYYTTTTSTTTTKTHDKNKMKKTKIFINMVQCNEIQEPNYENQKNLRLGQQQEGKRKQRQQWHVPYSLGPLRYEKDSHNENTTTFDICFHPTAIKLSKNQQFLNMMIDITVDAIDSYLKSQISKNITLGKKYHILRGIKYKSGKPLSMCISTATQKKEKEKNIEATSTISTKRPETKQNETEMKANKCMNKNDMKKILTKSNDENEKPSMKEVHSTKIKKIEGSNEDEEENLLPIPTYKIIYRGKFEFVDHFENDYTRAKTTQTPKELIVTIELPSIERASEIDLDVSSSTIRLETKTNKYRQLLIKLPFSVNEENGKARFDKAKHEMQITLPVVLPKKEEILMPLEKEPTLPEKETSEDLKKDEELSAVPAFAMQEAIEEATKISSETKTLNKVIRDNDGHVRWVNEKESALLQKLEKEKPKPKPGPFNKEPEEKKEIPLPTCEEIIMIKETMGMIKEDLLLVLKKQAIEKGKEEEKEEKSEREKENQKEETTDSVVKQLTQANEKILGNTGVSHVKMMSENNKEANEEENEKNSNSCIANTKSVLPEQTKEKHTSVAEEQLDKRIIEDESSNKKSYTKETLAERLIMPMLEKSSALTSTTPSSNIDQIGGTFFALQNDLIYEMD